MNKLDRIRPDNSDRIALFFGDIPSYPNLAGADRIAKPPQAPCIISPYLSKIWRWNLT